MIYFSIYILLGCLLASLMLWELEELLQLSKKHAQDPNKPEELHLVQILVTIFSARFSNKPITQESSIIIPLFILCGFLWPIIIVFVLILAIKIIINTLFK